MVESSSVGQRAEGNYIAQADRGGTAIVNVLTEGIASLPTDFASRVKNFLFEYLGTSSRPVPFGGRKTDLANLNNWLNHHGSPPYFLLAAPAGRGKSALLTHWSQELLLGSSRDSWAIVFFPISIRFRTNLASVAFAALTARLAALHGKKAPTLETPIEVFRGQINDYLAEPLPDGRRLLLILDGIDEASDWTVGPDFFPSDRPPGGLRIILSVRYLAGDTDATSWLRRLGWEDPNLAVAPDLLPLTFQGVSDVLKEMDCPLDQLAVRVDIVSELFRLSEGDPLLVRLYVDDLLKRGKEVARLQPTDLAQVKPGLEGYFDRWWEDQRALWGKETPFKEPSVSKLLHLLAGALGPLKQSDFGFLYPDSDLTNTFFLEEEILPSLKRFIIGDGKQGYTFSHPRLSIYFYEERLSAQERQKVDLLFLKWGQETVRQLETSEVSAESVSSYIVQYYGVHLERNGSDVESLLRLVSDGWHQSWKSIDGTYTGFLNDINRAWQALEKIDRNRFQEGNHTLYLGDDVRCALCYASVRSLAKSIPPTLLVSLVKQGLWTPESGLVYAIQLQPEKRLEALLEIIPLLPPWKEGQAVAALLDTLQIANAEDSQIEVLIKLLSSVPEHLLQEVLEFVKIIENKELQSELLINLAPRLPEALLQEALKIAQDIDDEELQLKVISELLYRLPLEKVKQWLGQIEDKQRATTALSIRSLLLALAGRVQESLEATLFIKVLIQTEEQDQKMEGYEQYLGLILLFAAILEPPQAIWQVIETLENESDRLEVLKAILITRFDSSDFEQFKPLKKYFNRLIIGLPESRLSDALEIVSGVEDKEIQVQIIINLAPRLPEALLQKALKIAQDIDDEELQLKVISELLYRLPLEKVKQWLGQIEDKQRATTALSIRSFLTILAGRVQESLEATLFIKVLIQTEEQDQEMEGYEQYLGLILLFAAILEPPQAIWQVIETLENESDRLEVLKAILITRFDSSDFEQFKPLKKYFNRLIIGLPESRLPHALEIVSGVEDKEIQVQIIINLAPRLPEHLLQEALKIAQVTDVESLVEMASSLADSGQLKQALMLIQSIENEQQRFHAISQSIPWLPEHLLLKIVKKIQVIGDESERVELLIKIAGRFWLSC